ncbi:hypothetical protein F8S09_13750 [Deinococcus sp. SDU3-2]|uniref:Uncharacterized protein n=1 Tax=Deinococcus terrestris TaxID=2651870 RepID=A0A7X1NYF6_9DEIO|nr:hypothetical protein [Deinococcus terrestris]MPY67731.1 hypothetical protein [Deinococcus terrestris]
MSIVETVYATLQEEGYRPRIGEEGVLSFRYYGQDGHFSARQLGSVAIGELECRLPRPAPLPAEAQQFGLTHPLAQLGERGGQVVLRVTTMMTDRDAAGQTRALLQLLDRYVADVVFQGPSPTQVDLPADASTSAVHEPEATPPVAVSPALPSPPPPVGEPALSTQETGTAPAPAAQSGVPAGWEEFWPLMHERHQPLVRQLARLGVPPPNDMQVDMLQQGQVKGTAIMMWGTAPNAVVICEPGQLVPAGYLGGTWLRHFTVEQVAASIHHNLKKVGLL